MNIRALKGEFGITGKKLGLWDYTLFEIGIIEIRSEIGIMGFHTKSHWLSLMRQNWDYRITSQLKLGLCDYTPCEIGIRPFKIDCLFCASARRIYFNFNRNIHTKTRPVPEHKTVFGLKKYAVEAEKTAFKVGMVILVQCGHFYVLNFQKVT